ncbi:nucleotidyltransferase domain-containing protein [uncultured Clostridium sp.]|uniref:nucleotidyltransferase domain-containing protein n=1 Tax=uncultured Clostridium sp. TaxID=59620 RepID=UPI0028EA16FB|nr:nucleotidyltransferase domain-containing protein [uncultured Clostridium sp.]
MEPYQKINEFRDKIIETFKDRVDCILLTGSLSRGEVRKRSDIDIWVFLHEVKYEDLYKVGEIVKSLYPHPRLNPQITSFEECLLPHFTREYSPIQYRTDGKILYGSLKVPYPNKKDFIERSKNLVVYIIMGIRHFICINEGEESLLSKKLLKRILKPLMWVLRYKYAAIKGVYPLTLEELKKFSNDEEIYLINIFENLLEDKQGIYEGKIEIILEKTYKLCQKVILELESSGNCTE